MMGRDDEFIWLIEQTRPKSVLEIGSYAGGSLRMFRRNGVSSIRSIDQVAMKELQDTCKELDIPYYTGDSKSSEARQWADSYKPYDLIFIDGDHSYEGVQLDYQNYGYMGKFVAFHDIFCEPGVIQFFREMQDFGTPTKCIKLGYQGIGYMSNFPFDF